MRRSSHDCRRATAVNIAIVPAITSSYLGFEVQATKRLANRWMARVGFSTSTHREYLDDPSLAVQDPTSTTIFPNIDGAPVVTPSSASGKSEIYMISPRYQFNASGALSTAVGHQCRRQPGRARRIRAAILCATRTSDAPRRRSACCSSTRMNRVCRASCRSTCALARPSTFSDRELAFDLDLFNVLNRVDGAWDGSTTSQPRARPASISRSRS